MYRWNALDDADAWRAVAMDRRNRGQSTGKSNARLVNPRDRRDYNDTEKFLYGIRAGFQCAKDLALEDYRRAAFPERYEDFWL